MSKSKSKQLNGLAQLATRNAINLLKEIRTFAHYTSENLFIVSIERPSQSWYDMGEIVLAKNRINNDGEVIRYTTKMKFGKENQNGWYSSDKLSFNYSFGESYDNPKHVKKPYKALQIAVERIDDKIEKARQDESRNRIKQYKRNCLIDAFSLQEQYSQPCVQTKMRQLHEPKLIFHFPRSNKADIYNREWAIEVEDPCTTSNQVRFKVRQETYTTRRASLYRNLTEEQLFMVIERELELRVKLLPHEEENLETFLRNNIEIDDYAFNHIKEQTGDDGRFAYTKLENRNLGMWNGGQKTVILDPVTEKEVA